LTPGSPSTSAGESSVGTARATLPTRESVGRHDPTENVRFRTRDTKCLDRDVECNAPSTETTAGELRNELSFGDSCFHPTPSLSAGICVGCAHSPDRLTLSQGAKFPEALVSTSTEAAVSSSRPPGSPWPIADAAAFLAVSTRHLHRLLDAGKARSVRLGRRRLIPDAEVQRLAREGC
jgi:excisionase family DNA binding protein